MSALEVGRRIRAGELTSLEAARQSLKLLEDHGGVLNAVAELTPEIAIREARLADGEIRGGYRRGLLHGVPYGAKDLFAVRGIPTRWGSPAHKHQVFDYDATAIQRMRSAGAVLVAKLAMVELAGGGGYDFASASITGPCRNPWNHSCWAGGSSSGSGAAVGAGLVPLALGTETWGSITVPSAFCGVSGLRPTYGRVSRHGAMALSWTMDKIGALARTALDCAAALEALAGPDPYDISTLPMKFRFARRGHAKMKLRLGLLPTPYKTSKAADAERLFAHARTLFEQAGHTLVDVKLPNVPFDNAAGTIVNAEGSAAFENLVRSVHLDLLADTSQQAGLIAGLAIPAVDYIRAMRIRTVAAAAVAPLFKHVDALIAPTLLHGAPPVAVSLTKGFANMGGNGGPGNLLGWPAISVPMGFTNGMPLGLEIIAPPFHEQTILTLAAAYQHETKWHLRHPE